MCPLLIAQRPGEGGIQLAYNLCKVCDDSVRDRTLTEHEPCVLYLSYGKRSRLQPMAIFVLIQQIQEVQPRHGIRQTTFHRR